jgi:hypothetical protein
MKRRIILSVIICGFLLVLPLVQIKTFAQDSDVIYFPQTDHSVSGEFLEKFNSVSEPVEVFGYPITEAIVAIGNSPFANRQVQYFQRAIFEYHPENAPGHQVQLVPLGKQIFEKAVVTPYQTLTPNHPACQSFTNSTYQVCYAFLSFFRAKGGEAVLGAPISEMVWENERIVQYFEYARIEWRPEKAPGHRVVLTNLGELYFNLFENEEFGDFILPWEEYQVRELHVSAFPLHAVIADETTQSVFVIVKDQLNKPVQAAQVTITIITPDQQKFTLLMPSTDDKGITSVSYTQVRQSEGRVQIVVEVNYANTLTKISRTSYRIW